MEQRKGALFQQLDLSGLEGWSGKDKVATHALLVEYHYIFSLQPGELGCTDLAKHEIKFANNEPFKERFRRIPPPMVGEVHVHMEEMLKVGTIHPSQNPWCNAIMLVCKKDVGLHITLTSTNTQSHQEFSRCRTFLLLGFEGWFLIDSTE